MLIFDENTEAIILESIYVPTLTEYFYILDLNILDFTLTPLLTLEEINCPSLKINVRGFEFVLPATWSVLVYSEDTHQLDVVEVSNLAGNEFSSMVYGNDLSFIKPGVISVMDYYPDYRNVAPALNKHQMLCHPIGPTTWINISPSDTYNKFLKDKFVGDIVS